MPPLALGMLPILALSLHFGRAYQRSSRELKRLESVTRSPIYSAFEETVRTYVCMCVRMCVGMYVCV
jgi:hypothetical protein